MILFIVVGWSYINPANLHAVHSAEHRRVRPVRLERHRSRGAAWSSSPSSDSTRSPRPRRKRRTRSATCRSASSVAGGLHHLYILFSHVLTGIVNYTELNNAAPVARRRSTGLAFVWLKNGDQAGDHRGLHVGDSGDAAGPVARVLLDVARRPAAEAVHRHPSQVPDAVAQQLLFMVFVGLFAAFAPIQLVGEMTSIGTLFAFVMVCAGIMVMRRRIPSCRAPSGRRWCLSFRSRNPGQSVPDGGLGWENWLRLIRLADYRPVYLFRLQPAS